MTIADEDPRDELAPAEAVKTVRHTLWNDGMSTPTRLKDRPRTDHSWWIGRSRDEFGAEVKRLFPTR